jgi:hypothetical protein
MLPGGIVLSDEKWITSCIGKTLGCRLASPHAQLVHDNFIASWASAVIFSSLGILRAILVLVPFANWGTYAGNVGVLLFIGSLIEEVAMAIRVFRAARHVKATFRVPVEPPMINLETVVICLRPSKRTGFDALIPIVDDCLSGINALICRTIALCRHFPKRIVLLAIIC